MYSILAMALSNFWLSYTAQAIFCAMFGITSGAYVGLTSVVLVDLLGLDNLTNAFGLLLLFQGIASVIGPPFIGKTDFERSDLVREASFVKPRMSFYFKFNFRLAI